ncbi:hypothetical protein ACJJTC_004773 [Scirpophaga incertulas]
MAKATTQAYAVDNFIGNWNSEFPDYPLTVEDLKKPHAVMGALFQVFDRLGIDIDAVLSPPPEDIQNEHIGYYYDLLPVINMTRIINYLASVMPQVGAISITHFLQPTVTASHSILLLLFNFIMFNEERLREIAPREEELFLQTDRVKELEDKKNELLNMLNIQAEEKGERAERLEKLDEDTKQFEEELKQEREAHEEEKQKLENFLKENHQLEVMIEQKKGLKEAMLAEIERKRALRVYDADDIKAQAQQASQNAQEAEEKLNTLQATLMEKENNLKNLQTIKPRLDTANNLLQEIMKLSETLKDYESGDLECNEDELEVLTAELKDLESQLAEVKSSRVEVETKLAEERTRRHHQAMVTESILKEAEEKDKVSEEKFKKAVERTQEIKDLIVKYESEKTAGAEEMMGIKNDFINKLKAIEEVLLNKFLEVKKRIEDQLQIPEREI